MIDFLLISVIMLIIGAASAYILKAKRSGVKCIGCPSAGNCCGRENGQMMCDRRKGME